MAALKRLMQGPGFEVYNLGTGHPTTVLQLVSAFKTASAVDVPYQFVDRRPGDVAWLWCSPVKAKVELGWSAQFNIEDMCDHMWHFQKANPTGYVSSESSSVATTTKTPSLFAKYVQLSEPVSPTPEL